MKGCGHGEKRSRKSEQFISALLTCPTVEAAARAAHISETTAWRWMKDPDFKKRFWEVQREAMRQTTARLQQASAEAVDALRDVQRNGESESARVAAARTVLEQAVKAQDLQDIQERLEAVERSLKPKPEGTDENPDPQNARTQD